jgi:purine-binding chemotaxis protein CheW
MNQRRVATFWVGDLLWAIDVQLVQEVLRSQTLTPVPLAHPCVHGLFNLRGEIVTAIDVRRRLGLPPGERPETNVNFVLASDGDPMSLVVDREGDVVALHGDAFDVPQTIDAGIRSLISGVYERDRTLLLVIDVDRVLSPVAG